MEALEVRRMLETNSSRLEGQRRWLDTFPDDIGTILDVGAGAGAHSAYFANRGYKAVALDYNAQQFNYHGQIEFIEGDLMGFDGTRRFDAIFLSHVLEHIPDTLSALTKISSLVKEGGYLFLAVPPYDGRTGNDHCHIGWNCAQLAMWLIAAGFDCSQSTFMEIGENVCGWGRKSASAKAHFHIPSVKKYLPKAWANACFVEGADDRIPDAVFANSEKVILRTERKSISFQGALIEDACKIDFDTGDWSEVTFAVDVPIDLENNLIEFGLISEHDCEILRVVVSSDRDGLDCYADAHIPRGAGISTCTINEFSFITKTERDVDFRSIRQVSVGGKGRGIAHLWAVHNGVALRRMASDKM